MKKYRKILLFAIFCCFNLSSQAGKCIRGEEPNKLSLLKAQSQQDPFLRELNELASIANANPDSLEAQNKFQDKHNILRQRTEKIEKLWLNTELPEDLDKCEESNLPVEQFRILTDKWDEILKTSPENEDYIYNNKLLIEIAFKKFRN